MFCCIIKMVICMKLKKLLATTIICTITAVLLVSCSCAGSVPNTDVTAETTLSAEANTKDGDNRSESASESSGEETNADNASKSNENSNSTVSSDNKTDNSSVSDKKSNSNTVLDSKKPNNSSTINKKPSKNNSSSNQTNTVPTQPQGGVIKDNVTVKFDDLI